MSTKLTEFEIIFVVDDLSNEQIDALIVEHDCVVSTHSGLTLVTATCSGVDAVCAGHSTGLQMRRSGVIVHRTYPDLVDRRELARRAQVTTQAVGLWVRGERQRAAPFPRPTTLVGGDVWLWADVNGWLKAAGLEHVGDLEFPTLAEHARLDVALQQSSKVEKRLADFLLLQSGDAAAYTITVGHIPSVDLAFGLNDIGRGGFAKPTGWHPIGTHLLAS